MKTSDIAGVRVYKSLKSYFKDLIEDLTKKHYDHVNSIKKTKP